MKRSTYVSLLVLGSVAALAYKNDKVDLQQQEYASREDCVKDWGDESQCSPTASSYSSGSGGGGGGGGGSYRGPRYYWDHDSGRPMVVSSDGGVSPANHSHIGAGGSHIGQSFHVGSISRGGFGGSFHGFSGGG
ncbi:MAG TPA: hypothetical protein VF816_12105 [Rhodocyclaceae bacterium]